MSDVATYKEFFMGSYVNIEKIRTTGRHYVRYDYKKLDPTFEDKFDITLKMCKFAVQTQFGVSKLGIIKENIKHHDSQNTDCDGLSYKDVKKALYNTVSGKVSESDYELFLSAFDRCCTVDCKQPTLCQNMLLAMASIDFETLIKDIELSGGDRRKMLSVVDYLEKEVMAAAINGLFSALSTLISLTTLTDASQEYTLVDHELTEEIDAIYKKAIFDGKYKGIPLEISQSYELILSLAACVKDLKSKYSKARNMSVKDVMKLIVKPFDKIIDDELDKQYKWAKKVHSLK